MPRRERILHEANLDRQRLASYLFWFGVLANFGLVLATIGVWALVFIPWCLGFGQWYSKKLAHAYRYALTRDKLIVEKGVFFLKRKQIPLEKITEAELSQGILERRYGLWRLKIQTASTGTHHPEGNCLGLIDPERFRQKVLDMKQQLTGDPMARSESSVLEVERSEKETGMPSELIDDYDADRWTRIEELLMRIEQNTRPDVQAGS